MLRSSLCPTILKRIVITPSNSYVGDTTLELLTHLLQRFFDGEVPAESRPFFYGAKLIGVLKKDNVIRPISIDEILCRLLSKMVVHRIHFDFENLQFGLCTPLGNEQIIHDERNLIYHSS